MKHQQPIDWQRRMDEAAFLEPDDPLRLGLERDLADTGARIRQQWSATLATTEALRRRVNAVSVPSELERRLLTDLETPATKAQSLRFPVRLMTWMGVAAALLMGAWLFAPLSTPGIDPVESIALPAIDGPPLVVTRAKGGPQVWRDGVWQPLVANDLVVSGDRLRTPEAKSRLNLAWQGEETTLSLSGVSEAEIKHTQAGKRMLLLNGTVRADIAPQSTDLPLAIYTPNARVGVLGTAFTLRYATTAGERDTHIDMTKGTVSLASRDGTSSHQLTAGMAMAVQDIEPALRTWRHAPHAAITITQEADYHQVNIHSSVAGDYAELMAGVSRNILDRALQKHPDEVFVWRGRVSADPKAHPYLEVMGAPQGSLRLNIRGHQLHLAQRKASGGPFAPLVTIPLTGPTWDFHWEFAKQHSRLLINGEVVYDGPLDVRFEDVTTFSIKASELVEGRNLSLQQMHIESAAARP